MCMCMCMCMCMEHEARNAETEGRATWAMSSAGVRGRRTLDGRRPHVLYMEDDEC